ncbi:ABC-F family ATP-binding cassette domain-containing protein [Bengtsoniella intestinalis]|uniref:ABC-F family ATP-binding cassette domain-containing protein n=1 Tax=Bengtsoniella intestinalis TaxID=3073143 RepID=UPI00391F2A5A
MLLSAEKIALNFGGRQLLDDVNFYLNAGDKVGIIGINGTGKSTFLKVLSGTIEPDSGTVLRDPNVQVSFLSQNPDMDENATVLEQVFASFPKEFRTLNEYEALTMLGKLGVPDPQAKVTTLSGGQRKRVALATALINPGDVLILDEPTNHLDSDMVTWLEQWLTRFTGSVVMVTHDRYFLERVANRITEVTQGKLYHYEANYSLYLELREQRQEMMFATERKRQAVLRLEFAWISRGCRARTTKSRERIDRYEALKAQDAPVVDDSVQLAATSSRLGRKVIELDDISKAFGDKQVLQNFSYTLLRSDRIGIVGQNGAGKSTLLNLIVGDLTPDSGYIDRGTTVRIGYFSQEGRELDLNQRVYDFIHNVADEVKTDQGSFTAKDMMERFLFPAELQSVPIGRLSGGERRRLYLLSILMSAPNILLLDEPTNDLDVTTLAILEEYLQSFPGPILTVSHDRWFLDKLAEQIFEVQNGGHIERYVGNWSDYNDKRKEAQAPKTVTTTAPTSARPERQKKLKFTFKEQREFDCIDQTMADAEEALEDCATAMGNCGSDYVELQKLQEKHDLLEKALEEVMERWVYLNDLKEQIDAQG